MFGISIDSRTVLILFLLAVSCFGKDWIADKIGHRPAVFSTSVLQQLCSTNKDSINYFLDNLCVVRKVDTPEHRKVGEFITNTLENLNYHVKHHDFEANVPTSKGGSVRKKFRNIIARKDPHAKRYLTLVCHYDSKDCDSEDNMCVSRGKSKFKFYGAIDSAAPCAMMLDVATSLNQHMVHSNNKDLSLQLIFLDGEEAFRHWSDADSIYGARELAEKWSKKIFEPPDTPLVGTTELDRMDVFVLLDLLGSARPTIKNFYYNYGRVYMQLPNIESKLMSIPHCLKPMPMIFQAANHSRYQGISDDHLPFIRKGVSIVHLIPSPFPAVWHREDDTKENLDMNTVLNIATILRVFTAQYIHLLLPEDQVCEHWPCPGSTRP